MKTSLDFDMDEYKFQPKMSILELVFAETKQAIGHVEFDLGQYTNKIRDQLVKTILDLKSDKFPGCQIYIYVQINLLDPLPDKNSTTKPVSGGNDTKRVTVMEGGPNAPKFDIQGNLFDIKKKGLLKEI